MELPFLNTLSAGNCQICGQPVKPVVNGFLKANWYPRFCQTCAAKLAQTRRLQEQEAEMKEARTLLGLPPRFFDSTFENFKQDMQPTAYLAATSFAEQYPRIPTRGLYLFGSAGSGKTHLAAAIGNKLVLEPGVRFVTAPELLMRIRRSYNTGDDTLDRLSFAKLLIIDDLGSEKPTEWVQETLFVLIDRRYTHNLPTVITSNYSMDQLKDRLGMRIASRLAEVSQMVELRASDYRIKQTP